MHDLRYTPGPAPTIDNDMPAGTDCQGAFSPVEMKTMQDMYDASKRACGVSGHSDSGEALGRAVIRLFRDGVRNPSIAADMLRKAFFRR